MWFKEGDTIFSNYLIVKRRTWIYFICLWLVLILLSFYFSPDLSELGVTSYLIFLPFSFVVCVFVGSMCYYFANRTGKSPDLAFIIGGLTNIFFVYYFFSFLFAKDGKKKRKTQIRRKKKK